MKPFIELTEESTGQTFHVRTNTINCVIDNGKNTVVQIRGGRMHVEGTVEEILRRINDLELPLTNETKHTPGKWGVDEKADD